MEREIYVPAETETSADSDVNFLLAEPVTVAAILILPFLVLYWLVPFVGKYTIGGDYLGHWILMQLFLQFSIKNGTFPLYAPGFNDGWTSSALTLGQLWHPISWLASLIPGYWNGYALQINTLLRLFSLGGTHLVLFLFLRRLHLTRVSALVISFIAVYNLRMLDMFRYAASLENYLAYLLLCTAVGWHYVVPTRRTGPVCIALSTWLLVVGGHPQIMYFGLLAAALVCIIIPFYVSDLLQGQIPLERRKLWGYWGSVSLSVVLGILLASPYILPFYFEYLPESYRGSSINFNWACNYQDTLAGNLCNFFNPFYSGVHGAFGGSVLMMVSALMPLLLLLRVRIPWSVLFIWMICLITFVLVLGSNGPLYYYFWKYFPFIRTFRVPGRLGIIFSFMNVLILTWLVHLEAVRFRIANRQLHLRPAAIMAATALILFVVLRSFNLEGFAQRESWMPVKINRIPSIATVFDFTAGMVSLVALIFYSNIRRFSGLAAAAFAAAVLLQVTVVLRYGTWIAPAGVRMPTFGMMQAEQSRQLGFKEPSGDPSRRIIVEHLNHSFLEHKTIARLCPKYTVVGSREEAYKHLEVERAIDYVFVENYPATQTSVKQSVSDAVAIDRVELKYNSFNNLKFDVDCTQGRFFVFSYPYSQYWRTFVDEQRVPVYRCNGIEQCIWLVGGRHTVEFRYWSWPAVVGAAVGSLSLFLTASILLAGLRHKFIRYLSIILVLCVCISAFIIWYHSLYGGNNIGTRYVWTSEEIQPHLLSSRNLAYGKPTIMSKDLGMPTSGAYFTDSSVGVDGDRTPENWFITSVQEHAWWQVDLGRPESIGGIVLYKRAGGYKRYGIPFDIIVSADGEQWSFIYRMNKNSNENNWHFRLKNVTARYVRLQLLYKGYLSLAEVEIYGPK